MKYIFFLLLIANIVTFVFNRGYFFPQRNTAQEQSIILLPTPQPTVVTYKCVRLFPVADKMEAADIVSFLRSVGVRTHVITLYKNNLPNTMVEALNEDALLITKSHNDASINSFWTTVTQQYPYLQIRDVPAAKCKQGNR